MTNAVTLASLANSGYLRNRIINGNMQIDQRNGGAAVTATGDIYSVDRWAIGYGSPVNAFTAQQSAIVPANYKNSLLLTMGTGASPATTGYAYLRHPIEGLNVADLGWGTSTAQSVTISFWARSSVTGTFGLVIRNSAANRAYGATYTISSANTFEYKTITIEGDTTGTWLTTNGTGVTLLFDLGVGSNYEISAGPWRATTNPIGVTGTTKLAATTGATFYITGVQFEVGTQATPFEWRQYTTELQLCQRYFELAPMTVVTSARGLYENSTSYKVNKRTGPTLTLWAGNLFGSSVVGLPNVAYTGGSLYVFGFRQNTPASADSDIVMASDAEL